jgi:hypothetical protein
LFHRPLRLSTEDAENINFSIAVERTAIEKSTQQLTLRKRQKASILWLQGANTGILLPEGLSRFAFRPLVIINYPTQYDTVFKNTCT